MASHSFVIIGASFGGIPVAHGLLKDVFPAITASTKQTYKVTLISPSPDFYWKIGAPRAIVNPTALPVGKVLLPIAAGFKSYSADQFEFVQAYATSINPTTKTVETSAAGPASSIKYDSLVIASGTYFASPLWSTSTGSDAVAAALKDIHERLPTATSVVVAGGGAAGVETAGELAELYGGKKEITLFSGSTGLLTRLNNKNVGKDAEGRLTKKGLKIVHDVRVTSESTVGGKTTLTLSNGTEMVVDVYLNATGDRPNSKFVPEAWLNAKGFVKTDPQTLRLDVPEVTNVYGFGSVASYSDGGVMDTKFALKPILESIKLDLTGKQPDKRKNLYKKITSDMQLVPVGPKQGVGIIFGFKIPSFMVTQIKSKDFMIANAPKVIDGTG